MNQAVGKPKQDDQEFKIILDYPGYQPGLPEILSQQTERAGAQWK